jgi:hypothetical protein
MVGATSAREPNVKYLDPTQLSLQHGFCKKLRRCRDPRLRFYWQRSAGARLAEA